MLYLGVLATAAGVILAAALFIPFVAVSYRRYGNLTVARTIMWIAGAVYFCAIWAYTLLPLPTTSSYQCAVPNLNVFTIVYDLRGAAGLTDSLLLQIVLNIALFVPLGFFVRVAGKRGVFTAVLVGFTLSLLIEVTQYTGVWGVFPCAYRIFDVDDLLTNTAGAIVGSILAFVVPRNARTPRDGYEREPVPVTRGRRLVGAFSDLASVVIVGGAAAMVVQLWLKYIAQDDVAFTSGELATQVGIVTPLLFWCLVTLASGSTVGDIVVDIRYRGGDLPALANRMLRFITGIGGLMILSLIPVIGQIVAGIYALASAVAIVSTKHGRGLPGLCTQQQVCDARLATTTQQVRVETK